MTRLTTEMCFLINLQKEVRKHREGEWEYLTNFACVVTEFLLLNGLLQPSSGHRWGRPCSWLFSCRLRQTGRLNLTPQMPHMNLPLSVSRGSVPRLSVPKRVSVGPDEFDWSFSKFVESSDSATGQEGVWALLKRMFSQYIKHGLVLY